MVVVARAVVRLNPLRARTPPVRKWVRGSKEIAGIAKLE
jgi:hypothetical protein